MEKDHIVGRYALFLVGLFIASMGVALSTKAALGTSPVASVPYCISLLNDTFRFGGWLNLWSLLQIIITVALLRSKCNPLEIVIQTVLAFVYGYLTNFSCALITWIQPKSYLVQFVVMLAGCLVLALGIWIQYMGGVAMLPGEAMNRAISQVTGFRYENVKIFFDVFYIIIAAVICLVFFRELKGVREGSIIAAVLVGPIIKFFNRMYGKFKKNPANAEGQKA